MKKSKLPLVTVDVTIAPPLQVAGYSILRNKTAPAIEAYAQEHPRVPTQQSMRRNAAVWRCRCRCGGELRVEGSKLRSGEIIAGGGIYSQAHVMQYFDAGASRYAIGTAFAWPPRAFRIMQERTGWTR